MTKDHGWIAAHIPHQGAMCLLHSVLAWDEHSISCRAVSHRDPDHPLRAHGQLGAACAIEYAAQAMAVHAALLCGESAVAPASVGLLASARGVQLHLTRLDTIEADLQVNARRLHAQAQAALYEFTLSAADEPLASGRVSLLLAASAVASAFVRAP